MATWRKRERETMKPEYLIERQGKTMVLYPGLLDLAHSLGLKSIRTTLVQIPAPGDDDTAIVHATVEVTAGTFDGLGDASVKNAGPVAKNALIRLAETRAKA